jgi:molybdenum cofactor cytidylyltransferase
MANLIPDIAIVILAAGESKRMGLPKQLLQWGNASLIGHAVQTALKVPHKEVVVVLGANYVQVYNEIKHYSVTSLNNKEWEMGLGTSISKGINYIKNIRSNVDGVFIMLADQPFITSNFLELLIHDFKPNKNQIIATSYKKGTYGVPALFDKSYFDELIQLHDDFGAKYLLKKNESNVKVLTPPNKNIDLDTEEDYKLYRGLYLND